MNWQKAKINKEQADFLLKEIAEEAGEEIAQMWRESFKKDGIILWDGTMWRSEKEDR